jgi:alpha-L-arabinofuranosidase
MPVSLTINTNKTIGQIDENIYGHFLEHIYHSCNGGVWGDLVDSRSFENSVNTGFYREGQCVVQPDPVGFQRYLTGDGKWTNYEFSCEAMKLSGTEGFQIIWREVRDQRSYSCTFGAEMNTKHVLERNKDRFDKKDSNFQAVLYSSEGSIEAERWYRLRVRSVDNNIKMFLDDQLIAEVNDSVSIVHGRIGLSTTNSSAKFRNIKVTDIDGKILLS